jgi:DNA-directed RNA polymerase specialized sigma54-like protein
VLQKGSVLSFKLSESFKENDLTKLASGLGCHTESGLGQVVLGESLELLQKADIELKKELEDESNQTPPTIAKPQSTLIDFLEAKAKKQSVDQAAFARIEEAMIELKALYTAARRYNNIDDTQAYGPSKTQWGLIRDFAEQGNIKTLETKLLNDTHALIKNDDADWSIQTGSTTFRDWLAMQIKDNDSSNIRDLCAQITRNKALINIMEGK